MPLLVVVPPGGGRACGDDFHVAEVGDPLYGRRFERLFTEDLRFTEDVVRWLKRSAECRVSA